MTAPPPKPLLPRIPKYSELPESVRARIDELVAEAPPLSAQQVERLRPLFRHTRVRQAG